MIWCNEFPDVSPPNRLLIEGEEDLNLAYSNCKIRVNTRIFYKDMLE